MRIVMIGAGNLATNLGKALQNAGHDIVQVYSRTWEHAQQLATIIGGAATDDLDSIVDTADVYIFSLKDSALGDVVPKVSKGKAEKLMIHTAGSMPMSCFEGMAVHYGVLYPMQTFSKQREVDFRSIPCFIEGNDSLAKQNIRALAESISGRVYEMSSDDRRFLHLAAVWACNFTNHCYEVSAEILRKHDVPFDVMLPLIDETAAKVHGMGPIDAQTGPAVRFDDNVIRAQAAMMRDNPILKDLYERMSMSIHLAAQKYGKE
ncbi:MAG: DUF2520 domain-containing protein [Prevotella sp.]|nr:DUF2520 domain-containing protein [Prevotella sp.]